MKYFEWFHRIALQTNRCTVTCNAAQFSLLSGQHTHTYVDKLRSHYNHLTSLINDKLCAVFGYSHTLFYPICCPWQIDTHTHTHKSSMAGVHFKLTERRKTKTKNEDISQCSVGPGIISHHLRLTWCRRFGSMRLPTTVYQPLATGKCNIW